MISLENYSLKKLNELLHLERVMRLRRFKLHVLTVCKTRHCLSDQRKIIKTFNNAYYI